MESKARLRKRIKETRNELPQEIRQTYSKAIASSITEQPWYRDTEQFLVYSAIQSEVNLATLYENALSSGKKLYFPKVSGETMEFYQIDRMEQLCAGVFHVMEPDIEHLDLKKYERMQDTVPILVPGVAFSGSGGRIGYGKGYYDRYLAEHQELMPFGIAYACQLVDEIEAEPQDVAMHAVVTEEEIVWMQR